MEGISAEKPSIFYNPLILDSIFRHLSLGSLRSCRLVNWLWNNAASTAIRKSLKTRLLLCADPKCATDLKKLIEVFKQGSIIPYTRALLILDHLPSPTKPTVNCEEDGELELLLQISELFSDDSSPGSPEIHTTLFKETGKNGETVKAACDLFSTSIDNLILNMTLYQYQGGPENMEYWLQHINFPNLSELSIHITRTSPENLAHGPLLAMMNSFPNLRIFGLRKLTKKGDSLMNAVLLAFVKKENLSRVKHLSLEIFTDEKLHLEILLQGDFRLEIMSLIYLGGEVRFTEKLDLLKQFLSKVSRTLQHLYTHMPLFSRDQRNLPQLPQLRTLKLEKVYREFSISHAQIFDFDFSWYYPKIEKIVFKDYDIWKNMLFKTFPTNKVVPCPEIGEIALPDLCFDAPLMERYLMKFPNISKLSMIVSYVSRYQKQCSFCLVYASLPHLKELDISVFEVDLPMYDLIFTGMNEVQCKRLLLEKRKPDNTERGPSISCLKDLEILKIVSLHGNRDLGISDLSVTFGFLEMPSLRHMYIASSHITTTGIAQMAEKFNVTIWHKSECTCNCCNYSLVSIIPENRDY